MNKCSNRFKPYLHSWNRRSSRWLARAKGVDGALADKLVDARSQFVVGVTQSRLSERSDERSLVGAAEQLTQSSMNRSPLPVNNGNLLSTSTETGNHWRPGKKR